MYLILCIYVKVFKVTSMLVADVWNQVTSLGCWWQATASISNICHQHYILIYYDFGDRLNVTNMQKKYHCHKFRIRTLPFCGGSVFLHEYKLKLSSIISHERATFLILSICSASFLDLSFASTSLLLHMLALTSKLDATIL